MKILILAFITGTVFIAAAGESYAARAKVTRVCIEGNRVFSDRSLKRLMVTRSSSFFKTRRFFREVLEEDLEKLRAFYNDRGYLASGVKEEVSVDQKDNTAEITINIEEGERFRFSAIIFLGNQFFSDQELMQITDLQQDDYFSKKSLSNATSRLLSLYSDSGFSNAKIDTNMNINNTLNTVSVDFFIMEGEQFKISDIIFEGNQKTRDIVMNRELTFESGEYVNFSRLSQSRQNLLRTGLFESVFIRPAETGSGGPPYEKNIIIEVLERDSIELGASAGYDTREDFWQKVEITNRNLYGTSRKTALILRRSRISRRAEASFSSPWNFGVPVSIDAGAHTEYKKEPGFEVLESGGALTAGKTFRDYLRLWISYDYKVSNFLDIDTAGFKKKSLAKNIVTFMATYDSRDSLFYPNRGSYTSLKNEVMLGDFSFLRTSADTRFFFPLSSQLIAGSAVRASAIFTHLDTGQLPPDERLYTGGPHTVRGFEYQNLGPLDNNENPTGGKAEFVWNIAEMRLSIYKSLGICVFIDTGNLWESLEEINLRDLRTTAGGGIILPLPFGVFRLEYGIKVDRQEGEERGSLYFGTGTAF